MGTARTPALMTSRSCRRRTGLGEGRAVVDGHVYVAVLHRAEQIRESVPGEVVAADAGDAAGKAERLSVLRRDAPGIELARFHRRHRALVGYRCGVEQVAMEAAAEVGDQQVGWLHRRRGRASSGDARPSTMTGDAGSRAQTVCSRS